MFNKKDLIKYLLIIFFTITLFNGKILAKDKNSITIQVFDNIIDLDGNEAFIDKGNRTMVPIRYISEALNKEVKWDQKNSKVTIKDSRKEIILFVNKSYGYINNQRIFYDSQPIILNNRVYVPLRFISESFGLNVKWDQGSQKVIINDDYVVNYWNEDHIISQKPHYIAHGGGIIYNEAITNTREALENSLDNGLNFIEIDFAKTYDNKYVLLHGWGHIGRFFPDAEKRWHTYDKFLNLDMIKGLTQMSLEDLIVWLLSNKGVYIITDTKDDNIELLSYISRGYKSVLSRIIPQVYSMEEYDIVKDMGFSNIIYTLYKTNDSDEKILRDAISKDLFAVTMPIERVRSGLAIKLKEHNIFTYCHTINDENIVIDLKDLGVDGFYTDSLF